MSKHIKIFDIRCVWISVVWETSAFISLSSPLAALPCGFPSKIVHAVIMHAKKCHRLHLINSTQPRSSYPMLERPSFSFPERVHVSVIHGVMQIIILDANSLNSNGPAPTLPSPRHPQLQRRSLPASLAGVEPTLKARPQHHNTKASTFHVPNP